MMLRELTTLIRPPMRANSSGTAEQWTQVETALGVGLPADYKAAIATYGSGCFGDFIIYFNPFSPSPHDNLLQQLAQYHEAERVHRLNFPDRMESIVAPFSLFPSANGLIPFGTTTNVGDTFCWQTTGAPHEWPLVLYNLAHRHFLWSLVLMLLRRGSAADQTRRGRSHCA